MRVFIPFFLRLKVWGKRLKNCIHGKIPKIDAVRELLTQIDPDEIREIHEQTIDIIKRNRVFREGTIGDML